MTTLGQGSLIKVMEHSFSLCIEKAREQMQGIGSAMLRWFNLQSLAEVKSQLEAMHLIFGVGAPLHDDTPRMCERVPVDLCPYVRRKICRELEECEARRGCCCRGILGGAIYHLAESKFLQQWHRHATKSMLATVVHDHNRWTLCRDKHYAAKVVS